MAPKQKEMDNVLKRIFTFLEARDSQEGSHSLLVLVGDHGMNEVNPVFQGAATEIFS